MKKLIILTIASLIAGTACTKKRDERFAQGQGKDLETISEYDGKTFELKTGKVLSLTTNSRASNIKIDKDYGKMNNFDLVTFKTDAKLLKEIPFRGRENHTYIVKYELDAKMLRIMKVADEKDIPFQEQAFGEKTDDGKIKIPLMGYPVIGLYRVEKQKNSNNEDTNVFIEVPETDVKKATHFKLDLNAAQIFEAVEKIDVYPASLFDGEWYFAETIIGTAAGMEDNLGFMDAYDITQKPATKIRFEKTNHHIRGFNVNIDKRLNQNDSLNHVSALAIPVSWVDYEVQKDNGKNGLMEEIVREDKKNWDKRRYMKVDFDNTLTIQNDGRGSKVVVIEITNDYIGYTILRQDVGVRMKYSFLRVTDRAYTPKVYSLSDKKKFGFFDTIEEFIIDHTIHRKEDIDKKRFLNRFNPRAGKIVFHFTTSSPKSLRAVGAKAVEEWSKTFQKAAGMKVELDTSFDASLGDLRYNTINLIESVGEGGRLLGFGPSITDPHTGEIISATANVHVSPMKSNIIYNLRNYIRGGVGQLAPNQLPGLAPLSQLTQSDVAVLSKMKIPVLKDTKVEMVPFDAKAHAKSARKSEDFNISLRNFVEDLKRLCSKEVSELEAIYKSSDLSKEVPFLESCADKLLPDQILPTLLHEMGHNLGLRHNFTASNDTENFYAPAETGGRKVRTSSVMDYLSFNEDYMSKPGKYDEAAIRFGYGDTPAEKLGKFKFCTDEDVRQYPVDPMCALHDAGVTAKEVVENLVRDYKALYSTTNFRYDRYWAADQERLAMMKMSRYLIPMKRFYDQWRIELAQSRGLGTEYLENFATAEAFEAEYQKVKTPRLEDLRAGANISYSFLRNMVFLPNRYCVVKSAGGQTDLIELERIRYEIFTLKGNSIKACSNAEVGPYLQSKGLSVDSEIGYSLNDIRYSMDPRDANEPHDVVGTMLERLFAAVTLSVRVPLSELHKSRNLLPNYLDEPAYRKDFEMALFQRVAGGLTIDGVTAPKTFVPRFLYEKSLLMNSFAIFLQGLSIPERPTASGQRLLPYQTYITRIEGEVEKAAASIDMGGTFLAAMRPQNAAAKVLIETLGELRQLGRPAMKKEVFEPLLKFIETLPSKEGLTVLTAKDFLATIQKLIEIMQKTPGLDQLKSFEPVFEVFGKSKIIQTLMEALKDAKPEEAEQINNQNVIEMLKKAGFEYPLVKENFANLPKEIEQLLAGMAGMAEFYQRNKLDIDAQIDLITQLLIMNAN